MRTMASWVCTIESAIASALAGGLAFHIHRELLVALDLYFSTIKSIETMLKRSFFS